VRTVDVEGWLDGLELAPASKTKIKSTFSVLYSHAIRRQWLTFNPISKVRTSSKRLREKDVLTPQEFQALVAQLSVRDRAMVLLAGSTGLRRSELIALTWADVNTTTLEVNVLQLCVRNRFGETKTECSRRPVPLHPFVFEALMMWREQSLYKEQGDFLFASVRLHGAKPLSPDSLLKRSVRPTLERAGIVGKQIGWHNFRHSLTTNLRAMEVDVKVAQELLRHANSRTTLDIYTRAVSQQKRDANAQMVQLLLPASKKKPQHLSAPTRTITALTQLSAYCPCLQIITAFLLIRLLVWSGSERFVIRGAMKFLDIWVIGLVSIVFLSRVPSPLNSLKCNLISKKRLTALSAVCDLRGVLVACDPTSHHDFRQLATSIPDGLLP
jgi:integrase